MELSTEEISSITRKVQENAIQKDFYAQPSLESYGRLSGQFAQR